MKIFISFLFITFLLGCTTVDGSKGDRLYQDSLEFSVIKSSKYPINTNGKKEFLAYHSNNRLEVKAYEDKYKNLTGQKPKPFRGIMIIAQSGEKSNGGYDVTISDVVKKEDFIEVTVLNTSKNSGCLVTMALTNPYTIINIPNEQSKVKFVEKDLTVDCY